VNQNDPAHPDNAISIIAMSSGALNQPALSMDYGYFSGFKEIKSHDRSNHGIIDQNFPGKFVSCCDVTSNATNGSLQLLIMVNGVNVFSNQVDVQVTNAIHFRARH
jgi:hypothetical protein